MNHKHLAPLLRSGFVGTLLLQALLPGGAFAQATLNTQVNPGLITPNPSNLPEEQRPERQQQLQPQQEPEEGLGIEPPDEAPIVQIETPKFTIKDLKIEGVSLFSDDEISPLLKDYVGREVTLEELGKLVESLNKLYRDKGYFTTQAYIPPQDVSQGEVTIKVVEGVVGKMEVAGNKYTRTRVVARAVRQEPGQAFSIPNLEDDLLRVNRKDQFRIKAVLSPGAETGQTDLRLNVEERQPWQISPTFDNQGRPLIGTMRWGTEILNRNLLGYGDRLNLKWLGAAGTDVAAGSYFVPVNKHGTEIGGTFSYSGVDLDFDGTKTPVTDGTTIEGRAFNYGLMVQQPLNREGSWVADAGLNIRRIDSIINDVRTNRDDIGSLVFGLNFNKVDKWGRTFVRGETGFGANWFGGNRQFWKSGVQFTRLHRLPLNNLLIVRGQAQFTPDALPPAEQFQIGGAFSVRGYTEGLLVGDRGYSLTVEDRWPIPGLRYISPWLADRLQGAVFFDLGQSWLDRSNRNFLPQTSNSQERTLLMGTGVGLRFRLTRFLQGFTDFGFGLVGRDAVEPNRQPTARIHFGIRSDLLDDGYKQWTDAVHEVDAQPPSVTIDKSKTSNADVNWQLSSQKISANTVVPLPAQLALTE